ncbi:hypothetical protein [Brevibacillus sp. SIMBA_040]
MVQALLYPRTNPLLSKEEDFFRAIRNLQNSKGQYQGNRDIRQLVWRSQVFSSSIKEISHCSGEKEQVDETYFS